MKVFKLVPLIFCLLISSSGCKKRIAFQDSHTQQQEAFKCAKSFFSSVNSYQLPSKVQLPFYMKRTLYTDGNKLNQELVKHFSTRYPRKWTIETKGIFTIDEIIAIRQYDLTYLKVNQLLDFDYAITLRIVETKKERALTLLLKLDADNQWKIRGLGNWLN